MVRALAVIDRVVQWVGLPTPLRARVSIVVALLLLPVIYTVVLVHRVWHATVNVWCGNDTK